MARRNKLWRFAQLQTFANYYEAAVDGPAPGHTVVGHDGRPRDLRGRWAQDHFQQSGPLVLELACGRGEYTLALARSRPEALLIGVDIKGARIYHGARECLDENLTNAAFLRTRIEYLDHYFGLGEVREVWITFPDPFPRSENRRLVSPRFWTSYARVLAPGGQLHLKTDNAELFTYAREQQASQAHFELVCESADIDAEAELPDPSLKFQTYYERKHRRLGSAITYLRWQRRDTHPPSPFRAGAEAPAPPLPSAPAE